MKLFLIAAVIAVAAAAPIGYPYPGGYASSGYGPVVSIVRQSDERHGVQSSNWSYEGSDGTTRQESNAQKQLGGYSNDGYGNENNAGNTNQGTVYWVSPEGQRFTLTWTADENGFRPSGAHLPVPPPHPYMTAY